MNISLGKYAPYAKAVAAFIGLLIAFLTIIATALSDGAISIEEGAGIAVGFGTLVGGTKAVFQVRNKPASK